VSEAEGLWQTCREIRQAISNHIKTTPATQTSIAAATGITQGRLSQILSGKKTASILHLDMIAEASGLRITASITPAEPPQCPPAPREEPAEPHTPRKRGRKQPAHPWRL
jgi:transcriptional regulator with XRE-family HTH domain